MRMDLASAAAAAPLHEVGSRRRLALRTWTPQSVAASDARRRRHKAASELMGTGNAELQRVALLTVHRVLLRCKRRGCGALVSYLAALRCANAAGRSRFKLGDGCAGACCSSRHFAKQFGRVQRRMAGDLRCGRRHLVAWPADKRLKPLSFKRRGSRVVRAAIREALAR